MAGLVIAISFVLFAGGFLLGALLVVSVGIRAEDKAAMRRRMGRSCCTRSPWPPEPRRAAAHRAGQRGVPIPSAGDFRREDR